MVSDKELERLRTGRWPTLTPHDVQDMGRELEMWREIARKIIAGVNDAPSVPHEPKRES